MMLKLFVVAFLASQVIAAPAPQFTDYDSWWPDIFQTGYEWITGALNTSYQWLWDNLGGPAQQFFDYLSSSGNETVAEQAETVLGDESATVSKAEGLLAHAKNLLNYADQIKSAAGYINDPENRAIIETAVNSLTTAAGFVQSSGETILNKSDNITNTLVNSVDGLNDESVTSSVQEVGDQIKASADSLAQAGLALGNLLSSTSDITSSESMQEMINELLSTGQDLASAGTAFSELYSDILGLGREIVEAGLSIGVSLAGKAVESIGNLLG